MNGKVYLVGAGPGDPDLLTLKAARVLRTADVVLHDDLVGAEILGLIPPTSQLHNVGKRCGGKKITQDEINELMISTARSGLEVVRLKSGDPFIFGRAGEEITALREAGIEFELIAGVTAALGAAAAAQIPLTHRKISPALVFLPGHHAAGNGANDWLALVSLRATLVIYMPGYGYRELVDNLLAAGLPTETACAVVSRATTPEEQIYVSDLERLRDAPRLPAPSMLIVGDVVQLANPLVANASASWNCWLPSQSAPVPQGESRSTEF
jgi:uroporphyrin-III C-methyltransferase